MIELDDRFKIQLYAEFYQNNKDLFKSDLREYCAQCKRHCDERLIEMKSGIEGKIIINGKKPPIVNS